MCNNINIIIDLKQSTIDTNMDNTGAIAQDRNVAAIPRVEGCHKGPANDAVAHCHVCLSASAGCTAPGCLCKGIHTRAQDLANNAPVPPPEEKKDYQGMINKTRASIASLNTTLGNLSVNVTALEKTAQDTGISMQHQLDMIEAIIYLIKLNVETSDATSKGMVNAMR